MKKTMLAIASVLLLGSAISAPASAQSAGYYDSQGYYHSDDGDSRYGDSRYGDSRYGDSRYGDQGYSGQGYNGQYQDDDRYADPQYNDGRNDQYGNEDLDRDGVYDRNDIYDNRSNTTWDRDGDGRNDRYDQGGGYNPAYDHSRDGRYSRHMARHRYHGGRYMQPRSYRYSRYDIGSRLPANYYGSSYYVDYRPYGLSSPPRGYRWNRVGNDVYLVSTYNGLIRDVIYSLFY